MTRILPRYCLTFGSIDCRVLIARRPEILLLALWWETDDDRLNYLKRRIFRLERVKGIEPSYSAWKAAALPLSYTRVASL
jgi:hypothetical protein